MLASLPVRGRGSVSEQLRRLGWFGNRRTRYAGGWVFADKHCPDGAHSEAMMKRREMLLLLGGTALPLFSPLAAHAQQPNRVRRVGVVMGIGEGDPEAKPRVEALLAGLQE